MKVSEAIQTLSARYAPDDEIVILWWDRTICAVDFTPITVEEMAIADEAVEDDEVSQSRIWETIDKAIRNYRETGVE